MRTFFYDDRPLEDHLAETSRSIFLAGPTARGVPRTPWRQRVLELLASQGYDGAVVIPEFRDEPFEQAAPRVFGHHGSPVPGMRAVSYDILHWETTGIERSSVVLFWMPFHIAAQDDPASLPGFTTRAEVSRELVRAPHRIVLGMPRGAFSSGHIRYHAHRGGVRIWERLEDTVAAALAQIQSRQ